MKSSSSDGISMTDPQVGDDGREKKVQMQGRILVLGASGFIGAACAARLAGLGHEVTAVGRPAPIRADRPTYRACALDTDGLCRLVAELQPDVCVNAAGSGSPSASVHSPGEDFEANTVLVQRVLEALRREAPRCRYLGVSSAAVYGDNPQLPWREDARLSPRSPYGYHKLCAELLVEQYHRLHGLATLSVRAFSVYGPGLRKQIFWDLYRRSLRTDDLSLFGTGSETRDYLYIDDLVAGLALLAEEAPFAGDAINLGSGRATTVAAACEGLLRELGWRGTHRFSGDEIPGSPLRMEADMTRGFSLGFRPRIDLAEGLRRTAAWLKKTHDAGA